MSSAQNVAVRYVTEGGHGGSRTGSRSGVTTEGAKKTVSIHVGGLHLDVENSLKDGRNVGVGGSAKGVKEPEPSAGGYTEDSESVTTAPAPRPPYADGDATTIHSGGSDGSNNAKLKSDLLLMLLFGGSGVGLFIVVVLIAILFGIPIAMIVIGAVYMGVESCYDERIAILLLIGGILSLLSVLTRVTNDGHNHRRRQQQPHRPHTTLTWVRFVHCMIVLIDAVWFIVASVFVYRMWGRVEFEENESQFYCAKSLYLFFFVYLTISWTLFGATLCFYAGKALYTKCVCFYNGRQV